MKIVAVLLFLVTITLFAEDSGRVSLFIDAAYLAKSQFVKEHEVSAYVIRQDPKWLVVVEVTKRPGETRIAYGDVTVRLVDSKGQSLPLDLAVKTNSDYVEWTDYKSGKITGSGNYVAPRKEGQKLSHIEINIFRDSCILPLKKVQH